MGTSGTEYPHGGAGVGPEPPETEASMVWGPPMVFHGREGTVPHIGHQKHLCALAEQGHITLDEMKKLIRDPKFICKKCGRVAAKEENLCEPVPL